ncbi:superoxide dismutase family protein [Nocardia sp. CWNU-33]|uniref:superoxide dismutase family protein n=1 Tax=Nocardia sp. CWNU-33 TaxID=3392117 RepID=UPI00398F0A4F
MKVIAELKGDANVAGIVTITQADASSPVHIHGELTGLAAGKHGLVIHEFGDLSNGLTSAGPHLNPHSQTHGAPKNKNRHVGDLDNIIAPESGMTVFDIEAQNVTLFGPHSVIGRTVIVYADEDDLGEGGHELSLVTGNSGGRLVGGNIVPAQA